MSCNCKNLNEAIEPHPDEEFHQIKSSLDIVHEAGCYSICSCESCGQRWIVEELSRQPLLVKIGADFDSSNFDEIEYRRKIYIEANGGTTEEICAWKECEKFAINGMRICVEHAYPRET